MYHGYLSASITLDESVNLIWKFNYSVLIFFPYLTVYPNLQNELPLELKMLISSSLKNLKRSNNQLTKVHGLENSFNQSQKVHCFTGNIPAFVHQGDMLCPEILVIHFKIVRTSLRWKKDLSGLLDKIRWDTKAWIYCFKQHKKCIKT